MVKLRTCLSSGFGGIGMVERPVETGFLSAVFIFALSLGLVWAPSSANAAAGNVLSEQKISSSAGGLTGTLSDNDRFGVSTTGIGDLDGDCTSSAEVTQTGSISKRHSLPSFAAKPRLANCLDAVAQVFAA